MGDKSAADSRRAPDKWEPGQPLRELTTQSPPSAGLQHGPHVDGRGTVSTVCAQHRAYKATRNYARYMPIISLCAYIASCYI